jgi:hypothetical protein
MIGANVMIGAREARKNSGPKRVSLLLLAIALAMTLMCELFMLCGYFSLMSMLMVFSPGSLETWRLVATAVHMLAAALYFAAICGVAFCFLGITARDSLVRWLLIALSIVGISSLPIAVCQEFDDPGTLERFYYLAGTSLLLLINTLAAFHCRTHSRDKLRY